MSSPFSFISHPKTDNAGRKEESHELITHKEQRSQVYIYRLVWPGLDGERKSYVNLSDAAGCIAHQRPQLEQTGVLFLRPSPKAVITDFNASLELSKDSCGSMKVYSYLSSWMHL